MGSDETDEAEDSWRLRYPGGPASIMPGMVGA